MDQYFVGLFTGAAAAYLYATLKHEDELRDIRNKLVAKKIELEKSVEMEPTDDASEYDDMPDLINVEDTYIYVFKGHASFPLRYVEQVYGVHAITYFTRDENVVVTFQTTPSKAREIATTYHLSWGPNIQSNLTATS